MDNEFLTKWNTLSADEQTIGLTVAFAIFPIKKTDVYVWLKEIGIKSTGKKAFTLSQIEDGLSRCVKELTSLKSDDSRFQFDLDSARWLRVELVSQHLPLAKSLQELSFSLFSMRSSYWEYKDERGPQNAFRQLVQSAVIGFQVSFQDILENMLEMAQNHGWSLSFYWEFLLKELAQWKRLAWLKENIWEVINREILEYAFSGASFDFDLIELLESTQLPYMQKTSRELKVVHDLLRLQPPQDISALPLVYQATWAFLKGEVDKARALFQQELLENPPDKNVSELFLDHPLFFLQAPIHIKSKPSTVTKLNSWVQKASIERQFVGLMWRSFFRHLGQVEACTQGFD